MRASPSLLLLAALAGCNGSNPAPAAIVAPELSVQANSANVLSAVVSFTARGVRSGRVHCTGGGETVVTPTRTFSDGPSEIVVLGLLPDTDYTLELEVTTDAGSMRSKQARFRTGDLPAFLRSRAEFRAVGQSSGGYTLTNFLGSDTSRHYMVAYDGEGRVRWYWYMPGMGAYAEQLPNGNFAGFFGSTIGYQPTYGYFVELTPAGAMVARHQAPAPLYTDEHELLFTPAPGGDWMTHLFSYDIRRIDMTPYGGLKDARIAGHQILRYAPDGSLDFLWNAWDHFEIADWIEEPASGRQAPNGDFDHPNSLELDLDGNYVASFRNMAEVTKIDSRTGDLIWRFGGRNNEFAIVGDPLGKFCGQHTVRVLPNGNLLMFDNGLRHTPPQSRAVEYRLDLPSMTATMVWEYRHDPPVYTRFTGSVQRLANGNTIVGFALTGLVVEVDPSGQAVWKGALVIDGASTQTYRMKRIPSLYEFVPGHDVSRN